MTVKRYTPTQCCEHDGTYVTYSDYQKLVAENAALKKCCEAYYADGLAEYGDQWEVTPLQTPATDAAIAEIKAQGVALAIGHLSKKFTNLGVPITSLEWLEVELRAGRKG